MALADAYMMMGIRNRDDTINDLARKLQTAEQRIEDYKIGYDEYDRMLEELNNTIEALQNSIAEKVQQIDRLNDESWEASEQRMRMRAEFERSMQTLRKNFANNIASFHSGCHAGKWEFAQYAGVDDVMPTRTLNVTLEVQVPFDPDYTAGSVIEAMGEAEGVVNLTVNDYTWNTEYDCE